MRKVLDVGNCGFDHGRIKSAIERSFEAQVDAVATASDAKQALQNGRYDLILVNRILDGDGADGLALIQEIQGLTTPAPPMMLISNYPEYQAQAVEAGAMSGFGKSEIGQAAMLEALGPALAPS